MTSSRTVVWVGPLRGEGIKVDGAEGDTEGGRGEGVEEEAVLAGPMAG